MQYKIIDTHAHIFPSKIADKATDNISKFYDIKMTNVGNVENLLNSGKTIDVVKYIVHSSATTARQVSAINRFIISATEKNESFVGLASLHPDQSIEEMEKEIIAAKASGLKGVKLHPDFQQFNVDDEKAEDIYKVCEKYGFSILFHAGDNRYTFSKPYRIANMAKKYPNVKMVAAHFGGYECWHELDCYSGIDNIYFDTCSALFKLTPAEAKAIIDKFGVKKFMFGVDFPMWAHDEELERFMGIPLNENEREDILYNNAVAFYNI